MTWESNSVPSSSLSIASHRGEQRTSRPHSSPPITIPRVDTAQERLPNNSFAASSAASYLGSQSSNLRSTEQGTPPDHATIFACSIVPELKFQRPLLATTDTGKKPSMTSTKQTFFYKDFTHGPQLIPQAASSPPEVKSEFQSADFSEWFKAVNA